MEEKTEQFLVSWQGEEGKEQGPLDLLWSLIESYKIDIFSVSLEKITNDFISYMNKLPALDLKLASNFTLMASNLLYYKSRELLPAAPEEEETESTLPPELVLQLLEYKKFQQASEKLRILEERSKLSFSRPPLRENSFSSEESSSYTELSLVDLLQAFARFIKEESIENDFKTLEADNYSVSDKIDMIRRLFEKRNQITFQDLLSKENTGRGEVVAAFLALLELVKVGFIIALQESLFSPILLQRKIDL